MDKVSHEIVLRWVSTDLTNDKSALVQMMAWCLVMMITKPLPEPMLTQIHVIISLHRFEYIDEHKNTVFCRGWANVTFLHYDLQDILKNIYQMKGEHIELVSENMSDF